MLTPEIVIEAFPPTHNEVLGAFKEGAANTFEIGEVVVQPLLVIATL